MTAFRRWGPEGQAVQLTAHCCQLGAKDFWVWHGDRLGPGSVLCGRAAATLGDGHAGRLALVGTGSLTATDDAEIL